MDSRQKKPLKLAVLLLTISTAFPALAYSKAIFAETSKTNALSTSCVNLFNTSKLKEAIMPCLEKAKGGDRQAAEILARIYSTQGELLNYSEAYQWAKVASEQGSASSQAMLGLMYLRGDGIEKNPEKAQQYLQLAIDNGNQGAKELRKLMKRAGLWKKPS